MNCSFHTVRKALALLVEEDVLERKVGKGTFVKKKLSHILTEFSSPSDRINLIINPKNGGQYLTSLLEAFQQTADQKNINIRVKTVSGFNSDIVKKMEDSDDLNCTAIMILWFSNLDKDDIYDFVSNCKRPVVLSELLPHLDKCCFQKPGIYGGCPVHC
ncbi:MAG: GntR family transcriptional regulator [Kiritimatiellae bacterium]|nr:GntR family transcriptional regulator [Kiritimatiellia bacterium]